MSYERTRFKLSWVTPGGSRRFCHVIGIQNALRKFERLKARRNRCVRWENDDPEVPEQKQAVVRIVIRLHVGDRFIEVTEAEACELLAELDRLLHRKDT